MSGETAMSKELVKAALNEAADKGYLMKRKGGGEIMYAPCVPHSGMGPRVGVAREVIVAKTWEEAEAEVMKHYGGAT